MPNGRPAPPRPDAVDLLVVGAGPIGLACAIEAERAGLTARVVEKEALVNSIVGYPTLMEFFSTPELLEIGGHPLATTLYKPRREEALDYYRAVAQREGLDVRLGERVLAVEGGAGDFTVVTSRGTHAARAVVVATGFFDQPNRLGVEGEDLPHVAHYYKEPYLYSGRRTVVVGAKNSAAKAALEINRHGGDVTMVVRGGEITTSVKYWIRPDLLNRIEEGAIEAHFHSTVERITPTTVHVRTPDGPLAVEADFVLALIGYHPDFSFLTAAGVELDGPARVPVFDDDTMETTRPGLYLAGTVCGGYNTSRWFIENGRIHAARIAAHLAGRPVPHVEAVGQP
ncbi:YpdA family putative bacillithiol disulfide reductase [Rubrivirga sp. S365]|uniref:YpdA family putative bacillithiol disulfide reductase n=1 Tax=Rubrivirga litoralis TaxID=3075598 RepID=A0ABU3BP71_9BACT|nr:MULTISPECIES: YpdA family putative bacillithiol disulfide reductase [unclassified Rubrivirga]MDT0631040.1 YpdA family putative bacillithiol disulfide reductase [Rubrivirga sp. F394]MDT7855066.1 YpdA family putative bacillithiol disulfide reductase [Rubrivirga sp. S365]